MEFFLKDSLEHLRSSELKSFVSRFRCGQYITRKEDLMNSLHDFLINETAKAIDFLSSDEKLLLADIIHHGFSNPDTFTARYQREFPLITKGYERKSLVYAFITNQHYLNDLRIPAELKVPLKRLLPAPKMVELKTESELPENWKLLTNNIYGLFCLKHWPPSVWLMWHTSIRTGFGLNLMVTGGRSRWNSAAAMMACSMYG